mmetsp:Transcript_62040/g.134592  ORF Transcript_62040/g.134592 Transcript_62040/m.134592 type:complete len:288 (+) Transcript_62040:154-1017(+)|eukprot:CAMPEP_0170593928 /NCGR_PEP_ID=MMETSP0224-20130122/13722_1 /TAXON_ID=285029 /ORGANISM="Togula jolla, Strain CCCM 725" /LENGTH=287 /DNA_ID=CAMNT_0010917939 /DNA_START=154 /DNA_END=1017 /DNA_ORIENTATION=+
MPSSLGSGISSGPREPSKKARAKASDVLMISLLPWSVFSLIVCLLTYSDPEIQVLVWGLVAVCAFLSILFIILGKARAHHLRLAMGFLALGAVFVSVPTGMMIESEFMAEYWRLDSGASYKNLRANEPGAAHHDATMLHFVPGTAVVLDKSLGYMKAGNTFCVAPVASGGAAQSPHFWAVGQNCCDPRGAFSCGDAEDRSALTAIAVTANKEHYYNAVRMAESAYGLGPLTGPPMLLHWTKDASGYKNDLWWNSTILVLCASLVHLLASGFAGAIVARALKDRVPVR